MYAPDHINYCNINADIVNEVSIDDWDNDCDDPIDINIDEKKGDELLIELYRERPFLYDKSDTNFNNSLMKQSAWNEISRIMIETNCGDMYTPLYCQKRCISLRDQYSRDKRKAVTESKSGSAAVKATRFPFLSQLTFLDHVIKRRRSYTNCTKSQLSTINKNNNTSESQSIENESDNEENESANKQCSHIQHLDKENIVPQMKKRKVSESKELEQTLLQMSKKISNYMEKKVSTADDAFMEFIKLQFNNIPENEKNVRRKLIMDALTAPLSEK